MRVRRSCVKSLWTLPVTASDKKEAFLCVPFGNTYSDISKSPRQLNEPATAVEASAEKLATYIHCAPLLSINNFYSNSPWDS